LERLNRGEVWAWAYVTAEARCTIDGESFIGRDSLGGCSYQDRDDFMKDIGKEMRENALNDLRENMMKALRAAVAAGKGLGSFHKAEIIEEE
jgi:hypothetical protein